MLATNHVLAGALLGAACPDVPTAAVVGVTSHFALDVVPHWGCPDADEFLTVARRDGLTLLAALAALAAVTTPPARARMLAGALGGLAPDLNKPCQHFFGRSPFPRVVDEWHGRIQRESRHRMTQEIVVAGALAGACAAVAVLLRRR